MQHSLSAKRSVRRRTTSVQWNPFECPMIVRTVREVVTGSILIETCAMSHCHDESNEKFQRGLSFRGQESIREITKFNI
jgi:hypothetical protein